jgi:RNA polymerase sigma-70 factor (ECF subfamily)
LALLLDPAIAVVIDGGSRRRAIDGPARGVDGAAKLLIRLFARAPTLVASEQSINGQVGLVFRQGSKVVGVASVHLRAGLIMDVWIVVNPDKLRRWNSS